MTNDFKEKILKWLSGNYETESGNNVPQFEETDESYNDLKNTINNLFPYNNYIDGSLQAYNVNGDGLKYTIVYGEYDPTSSSTLEQRRGFILILNEDFDLVQNITQYSSGTYFRVFEKLAVGDDGNFFAIERTATNYRFVMMNNIIAKLPNETNYKVILKKAYSLQGATANISQGAFKLLIKAPEQSRYILGGFDNNNYVKATELVVNVGMSNEWNDYSYNNDDFNVGDIYANWSSSSLIFKIAGFRTDYSGEIPVSNYAELTGNSSNVGTLVLTNYAYEIPFEYLFQFDIKKTNENETYFSLTGGTDETYPIYCFTEIYHFKNGNVNKIYSKKSDQSPYSAIILDKIKNELFYLAQYTNQDNKWVLEIGKIINDDVFSKIVYESDEEIEYMFFTVQKQFNLYNYYIQLGSNVSKTSQIYSSTDYNGQEYQALNSMVPCSAELLSYQVPIFARDLYNRIINNNTTISILNVPNSYINNVDISQQRLYGETKSLLIENNDIYTTNVYEEVMFNFVNTLLMRNENNINNKIDNLAGAIRLNKSISSLLDYESCKLWKYKINYADNTNTIKTLNPGYILTMGNKKRYIIAIFVNKKIKNIQLLSNDENTIYQTIECSDLVENKYYVINQDLYIN